MIIYFGVMPTIILLCSIWLIQDYRRTALLKHSGRNVKAEIVNRRASLFTRPQFFFITYHFQVDEPDRQGKLSYTRKQRVMWKTYQRLKDVSNVDVVYTPDNPQNSQLAGQDSNHVDRLYALYLGLPVAIIWFVILLNFLRMLQG